MPKLRITSESGFTLIEVLLYIGIAGIILATIAGLLAASFTTRIKSTVIQEVELQGAQISLQISQAVRRSLAVNSPIPGDEAATLSLDVIAADPEIYSVVTGALSKTAIGNPAVALHSDKLAVSGLIFRNLSRPDTPDTIEFEFTLSYINTTGRNEYDYVKTFRGTGSRYELN